MEEISKGEKAMLQSMGISFPALEQAMKEREEIIKSKTKKYINEVTN